LSPLELYVELLDEANDLSYITFAFTVPDLFKAALKNNSSDGPPCFLLLEKEDRPVPNSTKPFVRLNADDNVYTASGAELQTTLGKWVVETDTRKLGLNQHVAFIHCKFLLHDALGDVPIVVTGSANFSTASTNDNDENMVILRGDRRVADIYSTEFNRLFTTTTSARSRNAPPGPRRYAAYIWSRMTAGWRSIGPAHSARSEWSVSLRWRSEAVHRKITPATRQRSELSVRKPVRLRGDRLVT